MNHQEEKRLYELFAAMADGRITEAEHKELQDRLREDSDARQLWFEYQDLETGLGELAAAPESVPVQNWRIWLTGRPWFAAAAGVVIGIFAASSVWALSLHRDHSHLPFRSLFFQETFEKLEALESTFPTVAGEWGGSSAEIVGRRTSVTPLDGHRMLRLDPPTGELTSRAYYIVDLEDQPKKLTSGSIELKAYYHELPEAIRTRVIMRAALFTGDPETFEEEWLKKGWSEIGDHALSQATRAYNLDPKSSGWQEMAVNLKASAEARYLFIMVGGFSVEKEGGKLPLFVDDVLAASISP